MPASQVRNRQVLRVFIASPSDLGRERQIFNQVIEDTNKVLAPSLGFQLEGLGWERIPPDKGRPQEIINESIRGCDLFILLLWQRWGTPSGSYTYTSGTAEEFELARHLSEMHNGRPRIRLYFKEITNATSSKLSSQVRQVQRFREYIKKEKSFLFADFSTLDSWESMFRDHLHKWLTEQPLTLPVPPMPVSLSAELERVLMHNQELSSLKTVHHQLHDYLGDVETLWFEVHRVIKSLASENGKPQFLRFVFDLFSPQSAQDRPWNSDCARDLWKRCETGFGVMRGLAPCIKGPESGMADWIDQIKNAADEVKKQLDKKDIKTLKDFIDDLKSKCDEYLRIIDGKIQSTSNSMSASLGKMEGIIKNER